MDHAGVNIHVFTTSHGKFYYVSHGKFTTDEVVHPLSLDIYYIKVNDVRNYSCTIGVTLSS